MDISQNRPLRPKKAILHPLNELSKSKEEASSGLIALERDIRRLEQIRQVVLELDSGLRHLIVSLHRGDTWMEYDDQGSRFQAIMSWIQARISPKPKEQRESMQKWLRVWSQQYLVDNGRLQEAWNKLLTSVNKEEHGIKIEPEWCEGLLTKRNRAAE